jgi:hypothetical protein
MDYRGKLPSVATVIETTFVPLHQAQKFQDALARNDLGGER